MPEDIDYVEKILQMPTGWVMHELDGELTAYGDAFSCLCISVFAESSRTHFQHCESLAWAVFHNALVCHLHPAHRQQTHLLLQSSYRNRINLRNKTSAALQGPNVLHTLCCVKQSKKLMLSRLLWDGSIKQSL